MPPYLCRTTPHQAHYYTFAEGELKHACSRDLSESGQFQELQDTTLSHPIESC